MSEYVFYINGMTCISCSNSLEQSLTSAYPSHFKNLYVDVTNPDPKKVTVVLENDTLQHPQRWHEIAQQIEDAGFEYEPYESHTGQTIATPDSIATNSYLGSIKKILSSHWFQGSLGCIVGIAFLLVSLLGGGLPMAAMIAMASISIILTLALGARSFYDAALKLYKSGTLTMDTLFALSTVAIIAVSVASFFIPWLPMMFEASLLIFGFRHVGLAIEESIKEKINPRNFKDRAPKKVTKILADEESIITLDRIQAGDLIKISPGEIIPVDGVCTSETSLYNTIVSGSPLSHNYPIDSKVLAGMRVAEHAPPFTIRANKCFEKSYLARLDEGIAKSLIEKAPIELRTSKILSYFIPSIISIAVISGIVIGLFFPPALAIQCAAAVLVSACPCTLGLIVPLAVKTGLHKSAEHGVQFKNAQTIQVAAEIDMVVIDLHGTLTTGEPTVSNYQVLNNSKLSKKDLLNLAYTLEQNALHPIGKALCSYAENNGAKKRAVDFNSDSHHAGIVGTINKKNYLIGSASLMQDYGITTAKIEQQLNLAAGDSVIYVAKQNKLIGYFITSQALRKDAKSSIDGLKKLGKKVHLCTGADEQTALRYANALGIDTVHANCVGTSIEQGDKSKPAYIESLIQQGHKVSMVGDGANDAHAIATSNFGVAVASADTDEMTQHQAGAIIQGDSLLSMVSTFTLANQTVNNIKQNLLMSLVYNFGSVLIASGILLTIGFALNPAIGAALMGVQACLILMNVYRFKTQSLPHLQEGSEPENEITSSSFKIQNLLPSLQAKPKEAKSTEVSHKQGTLFTSRKAIEYSDHPIYGPSP